MLFTLAVILLGSWFVSLSGIFPGGDLAHVLLLGGLMFSLLAFAKGRDAATKAGAPRAHTHDR